MCNSRGSKFLTSLALYTKVGLKNLNIITLFSYDYLLNFNAVHRARSAYCNSIKIFAFNNANELTFPVFPLRMATPFSLLHTLAFPTSPCGAKLRALACYRRQRREEGAHLNRYYNTPNDTFNYGCSKFCVAHCW